MLLVAGAACAMEWWDDDLCVRLAAGGRHVVRYDHRDTGESSTFLRGAPGYSGDALVEDCRALVDTLGLGPVHLVGMSMGGGIAQAVALRSPDRVRTLTLVSTGAVGGVQQDALPGPVPALAARADPAPEPDWGDRAAVTDWLVDQERAFAGAGELDDERTRRLIARAVARSIDPGAATNHWLVVAGADDGTGGPALDVRDLRVPTLVVHGARDPLFPLPHGEALAAAVPGAELLVLADVGHQVPPPSSWSVFVPALLRHTEAAAG